MRRHFTILNASILVLLLLYPFTAQAQTPEPEAVEGPAITIEGQITNATPGGSVPGGLPLMLHVYDGMAMADMIHGTADEKGRFRFEDIATAPGRTFGVMVTYEDVTYFSERVEPQPGQSQLEVPVSIYETTTDPKDIRVEQQHLLLDFTPGTVRVTQVYILSNLGDRAVVDKGARNLRFRLPAGAANVSFERDQEGQRFVLLEDGFADTAPVAPGRGTHAIMVNYELPHTDGDTIELEIPVDYPTLQTAVLLPEVGVTLDGPEWVAGEELLIRDRVHQVYTYREGVLAPGASLHLEVVGRPQLADSRGSDTESAAPAAVTVSARDTRLMIFILGVALSLTMIGSGTIWLRSLHSAQGWRDRHQQTIPTPVARGSESETLESVLAAIAELDDAYEAGFIDETEYQERRAQMRDEALALMMAQQGEEYDDGA